MHNRAFTLIELLVVVLIIGILAAVALPQYQKAVEKSRLTEALTNMRTIQNSIELFLLENGDFPSETMELIDFDSAGALQGGEWNQNGHYITKNFKYDNASHCSSTGCSIEIHRYPNDEYAFEVVKPKSGAWHYDCYTSYTPIGRSICKSLETQGWIYKDSEL